MWLRSRFSPEFDCARREVADALYKRLGAPAVSKTMHLVGNEMEAQDIVQQVFLEIWQKQLKFRDEKAAYAYVYAACTNQAIDRFRARKRRPETGDFEVLANLEVPATAEQRSANRQQLETFFASLPPQEAAVIAYRYVDGMSYASIIAVTKLSERTIRRILSGGRHKLRAMSEVKA